MIFGSHSSSLTHLYLGIDVTKHHTKLFNELLARAVSLINIEPESSTILSEKRYAVEGMLLSLFPEFQITGEDANGEPIYGESEEDGGISFARKLYLNIDNLELEANDSFSWPQYFGLLALMQIDHYIINNEWLLEGIQPPTDWPDWDEQLANSRTIALLDTTEAVCFGETLVHSNAPVQGLLKDKISKQAQQAVLKRHQPLRELKNAFINFYIKANDKSNKSDIARKFYRSLSDEDRKIICQTQEPHKAVRTLLNHLNKVINRPNSPYMFL